ncbi:RBBP9/YdeN family alpha/beta hydrolase [Acinetobacter dispersus]|uniref:RBBP9/YdeN family alpha/beta hydrolase n=1 Tax=Acinetobacter dispersus TaxID=70348 RepID=UPI00132F2A4D|nr:alpha/beta hydrolase [Acinetobacter dispersus]QHH98363.1 serine hydrolase family protein [Acinetobacter dispersus]
MKKMVGLIGLWCISMLGYTAQQDVPQRHIYIVPGYGATVHDHWFESVQRQIQDAHTKVTILSLPDPMQPDVETWQQTLEQNIHVIDRNTYFVAHSLGGITLLNFLSKRNPSQVGGIVLVSGFTETLPALPQLNSYILTSQNLKFNFQNVVNNHLFISDNDAYVPPELSLKLAKQFKIPYTVVANAGHFLAEDGYSEFTQLVLYLKEILAH